MLRAAVTSAPDQTICKRAASLRGFAHMPFSFATVLIPSCSPPTYIVVAVGALVVSVTAPAIIATFGVAAATTCKVTAARVCSSLPVILDVSVVASSVLKPTTAASGHKDGFRSEGNKTPPASAALVRVAVLWIR